MSAILIPAMRSLLAVSLLILPLVVLAASWQPRQLMAFTADSCISWEKTGRPATGDAIKSVEKSPIELRGNQIGVRHHFTADKQIFLQLDIMQRAGQASQFVSTLFHADGKPSLLISLTADCRFRLARKINYDDRGLALNIVSLNAELIPIGEPDWLNPPLLLPEDSVDDPVSLSGGAAQLPVRVAMVDSGVNYRLPAIYQHLARDAENRLIGYDFWDQDELPYDAHPLQSEFFVQRHGTRTASLLLREAPGIALVPYRYPRPDMSRMRALVEHAARHQVTILGMPLGSNRAQDWKVFEQAARDHPQMLFIVSAGNNGRDIDQNPVYPAALELENMLVVTSADDFVRPAERTNWGRKSVDYLIPAEMVTLTDYSGKEIQASGSSYAVARMAALAARLKMVHRQWTAADILAELRRRYGSDAGNATLDWVSSGYVADPLAGRPIQAVAYTALNLEQPDKTPGFRLPLDILVLDRRWTHARIEAAVQGAFDLLAQCAIGAGEISIHAIDGDDYLRDLSTGSARSLMEATATTDARVVFARDTKMQVAFTGEAFGLGNTRTRPWLTNSVWLMPDIEDEGIALAHELYHVIANSGEHIEASENLMQSRTDARSLTLTPRQCRQAQLSGVANRLLDATGTGND